MLGYVFLSAAVFFSVTLVSYLIHLDKQKLPLPVRDQLIDLVIYISFSAYWSFTVWALRNGI
jgi:hypothetical protein